MVSLLQSRGKAMIVFDELLAPVLPIIRIVEQKRRAHFNEKLTWPDFTRILIYFFTKNLVSANELIVSLQAAESELGLPKTSKRALSEGFWRFPPALLQEVLTTSLHTLTLPKNPALSFIRAVHVVDGSVFPLIHEIAWPNIQGTINKIKLHLKFSLHTALPIEFVLGDEHSSERAAFRSMLQAGQTYVLDRGYLEYQLVQDVDDAQAGIVLRGYSNMDLQTLEERPVSMPDAVHNHWSDVRDRIVKPRDPEAAHISFRLVECTVGKTVYRLITNLLDLTTFQIILLYAYRWQIELVFRYLKHTMHGVHIITQHPRGMQNLFDGLFLTALLHMHFKQHCLAEEGHIPPQTVADQPNSDDTSVTISRDVNRPTNHLAIARFLAQIQETLTRFWKISKHWLHILADCLSRPYTSDIVHLLNKYAV